VILLKQFTDKTTDVFFSKQAHGYAGENPLKQDMWYAPNEGALQRGKIQVPLSRGAPTFTTKLGVYVVKLESITVTVWASESLECFLWCTFLQTGLSVESKDGFEAGVKTLFICWHSEAVKQVVTKIYGSFCFEYPSVCVRHGEKRNSSRLFMWSLSYWASASNQVLSD